MFSCYWKVLHLVDHSSLIVCGQLEDVAGFMVGRQRLKHPALFEREPIIWMNRKSGLGFPFSIY